MKESVLYYSSSVGQCGVMRGCLIDWSYTCYAELILTGDCVLYSLIRSACLVYPFQLFNLFILLYLESVTVKSLISTFLSDYLSLVYLIVCMFAWLYTYLCNYLFIYLYIFIYLCAWLIVCLFTCLLIVIYSLI